MQLLVQRVELLVGRLQLLLGGVQLLVGRLQLLVAGEDLLVGGLQLFVRGFDLLNDRLQVFAARAQLRLEALDEGVLARIGLRRLPAGGRGRLRRRRTGRRRAVEEHQEMPAASRSERDHLDADVTHAAVLLEPEPVLADGGAALARGMEGRPDAVQEPLARHLEEAHAGIAGGGLEKRARLAAELDDLQLGVDDHPGWREALEGDPIGLVLRGWTERRSRTPLQRGDGRNALGVKAHGRQRRFRRLPGVDAMPFVLEVEQLGKGPDRLGLSQHEIAARLQRVVKDAEQPALQRGGHVDEHVPAHDQVDLREGRITCQVLAREDAEIAHRLGDAVSAVDLDEEAPQSLRRDVDRDAVGIRAVPRVLDGVLADVGGEDLNRDHVEAVAEALEQRDRDGVRLFARGTAGDPDADRVVAGLVREDLRKDLLRERAKGVGLAEETGDVDQEVLIQRLHLAGVLLQVAEVGVDPRDLVQHHAALQAPLDRRQLVVAKIDPAGGAQQREDALQLLVAEARLRLAAGVVPGLEVGGWAPQIGMARDLDQLGGEAPGGRTRSTMPVAMAARGMPSYLAVSGSCARVMPPTDLMSRMPAAPSDAVPDRMTPIARWCAASASERRKKSTGTYCELSVGRGRRCRTSSAMPIWTFGGIT